MTAVASSPSIRPWTVALALAAVVALGFGCGRLGGARPSGSGLNLLLVTLDTTRADRLGCYGHRAARTPRLDRLAAEGVRFETALADAPITLPSHASIFTGLHPFEHGVRNNGNFSLPDRFPTLATVLRERGYRTAAFVSSFILDRRYGLARGFEVYDDRMSEEGRAESAPEAERRGDLTAGALGRWLAARAAGPNEPPFFAWLHLYDPHEPYRPPSPFREQFAADPYDGEIAFADATVGTVLDALDERGLLARTLVAVVADHGESLGEHGEETHSMFLYESTLRVPLILWRPGVLPSGRVVRAPVRTVDLAPTLLDVLGAPALGAPHARSLRAVVDGGAGGAPVAAYAETYVPRLYMGGAALRMLRDDRYKLIAAPRPELYDLAADPGETRNRFAEEPRIAGALQRGLEELLSGAGDAMSVVAVDSEAAEKLNALGYVGAGAEAPSLDRAGEGKDPKDLIAVFNRLRRANDALRDRRFGEALPILDAALAEDPQNAFARMLRGNARLGLGQYGPALGEFRAYLALAPRSAQAHQWLAVCHLKLGDRTKALDETAAALDLDPRLSDARLLRAGVLTSLGRAAEAAQELRAAVAADPDKPLLRLSLAEVLTDAGRGADAEAEYRAILARDPAFAPALASLGALLARRGALDEASAVLRRTLEVDPGQSEARFNLAGVLERQGRVSEARGEYERIVRTEDAPAAVRAAARQRLGVARR